MIRTILMLCVFVSGLAIGRANEQSQQDPPRDTKSVSYSRDIAPILQRNCVACHRDKQAEGGLSLETPESVLAGGDSGAVVVASHSESSVLLARSIDDEDPMPPEDNSVGARRLTDQEVDLLKTWIDQGGVVDSDRSDPGLQWQPIPESVRSTFAMDLSRDGRQLAIGQANRVAIVDINDQTTKAWLVDDSIEQTGVADVDVIQAVAFSPDGDRVATGGFRSVRIWKRQRQTVGLPDGLEQATGNIATSPDGRSVASLNAIGDVEIRPIGSGEPTAVISDVGTITDVEWQHQSRIVLADQSGHIRIVDTSNGVITGSTRVDCAVAKVVQGSDGTLVTALGIDGKARVFRLSPESSFTPITVAAIDSIADATAVSVLDSTSVAVGTRTGKLWIVNVDSGKPIREIDSGSPVVALTHYANSTLIASGGSNGIVKTWKVADGTQTGTFSGTPETALRLKTLDQNTRREQSRLNRMQKKTEEIKKQLEKEDAALTKVTELRAKAAKTLQEQTAKRDETAKQIAATQQKIESTKLRIRQADESIAEAEKRAETSKAEVTKLTTELKPLEQQSASADAELKSAKIRVAEAMKAMEAAQTLANTRSTAVSEIKSKLSQSTQVLQEAMLKIETAKRSASEAKSMLGNDEKTLATQRETLAKNETDRTKGSDELAQRDQALVTATKTRELAADAVPKHTARVQEQTNRLGDNQRQLSSTSERHHQGPEITSVSCSPTESCMAVLDVAGRLRLFDLADSRAMATYSLPPSPQSEVGFLDDDRVTVSRPDKRPSVVSLNETWILERTIGGTESDLFADRVTALAFRDDGLSLAAGGGSPSRSGQAVIVAVDSGAVLRQWNELHSDCVLSVRFSPDGETLATAAADKTIRLLDVASNQTVGSLDGHSHHVLSIAWNWDGQMIASGSADGTIKTWDTETGQRKRTISGFGDEITGLQFLGESSRVVSVCANGQVRVHETGNGGQVHAGAVPGDQLFTVGVTADGKRVFASGQTGVINHWDTEGLKHTGAFESK